MAKRILVVDDDAALAHMVKFNLESTGQYEVRVVTESPLALSTAREFLPDLIILDYIMPQMDGGDISHRLQKEPALKHIPVIMVTALASNREMRADGTAERNGYVMLAKPIRFDKLRQCIEGMVNS
jgi:CheY-like chemotaxis protein